MKCSKCQHENPDDAKFCNECAHTLTPPSDPALKDLSLDEKLEKIQRYLPKGLTEKILSQRDRIESERKHVTALFSDMSGYTAISENLDPEEVKEITSRIFSQISHIVAKYCVVRIFMLALRAFHFVSSGNFSDRKC